MKLLSQSTVQNEFVIRGGGASFTIRQREMFEHLSEAAKKLNKNESCASLSQMDMRALCERVKRRGNARYPVKNNCDETMQYCGKESIFKRPEVPLATRRSVADHHRNPQKWIKYSLEDVPNEDMSDRSNTRAAFSFLRELRARRSDEEKRVESFEAEESSTPVKCKFTARVTLPDTSRVANNSVEVVEHDDRPEYRNGKIILPTYVVGCKRERKLKTGRQLVKVDALKQLKLDHLHEETDE